MPDKQPEPKPEPEPSEVDNVCAWRLLQATQLGYEWCDAKAIAESDADIHRLADLIDHGCPHGLAKRIA